MDKKNEIFQEAMSLIEDCRARRRELKYVAETHTRIYHVLNYVPPTDYQAAPPVFYIFNEALQKTQKEYENARTAACDFISQHHDKTLSKLILQHKLYRTASDIYEKIHDRGFLRHDKLTAHKGGNKSDNN